LRERDSRQRVVLAAVEVARVVRDDRRHMCKVDARTYDEFHPSILPFFDKPKNLVKEEKRKRALRQKQKQQEKRASEVSASQHHKARCSDDDVAKPSGALSRSLLALGASRRRYVGGERSNTRCDVQNIIFWRRLWHATGNAS
jgi:hypothetical protein